MIWICRLLCPKGHVMAAGATEAAREHEPLLARSFVHFLYHEMPVITCEMACYRIDLRTDTADLNVRVVETPFETLEEAEGSLRDEAKELRIEEFLRRSRN